MADQKDNDSCDANADEARNENLTGCKSTKVHCDEATQEQHLAKHQEKTDRQPNEIKATKPLLREDAERKSQECEEKKSSTCN